MSRDEMLAVLADARAVPVIRLDDAAAAERVAGWCIEEGFSVIEIAATCPDAAATIARLTRRSKAIVGAGTVLTAADARVLIDAGASFLVAPTDADEAAAEAAARGVPFIPGAMTPSEIARRAADGAAAVKVFPVRQAGGPGYIAALRDVFPATPLFPTGGVTLANAEQYLAAGAVCVGVGGALIGRPGTREDSRRAFATRAAWLRAAVAR